MADKKITVRLKRDAYGCTEVSVPAGLRREFEDALSCDCGVGVTEDPELSQADEALTECQKASGELQEKVKELETRGSCECATPEEIEKGFRKSLREIIQEELEALNKNKREEV